MRTWVIAVLLAVSPLAAVGQVPATVPTDMPATVKPLLKYIPDDAHLVLLVPDLGLLASGLSGFGAATGLPELAELTAADLVRELLGDDAAALDPAGAVLITLSACHDEPLLIATPAKGDAWESTTRPIHTSGGVDTYEFAADRFVVAVADQAVIFARERSELARGLDSGGRASAGFAEAVGGRLRDRQVVLYINVPGWRERIGSLATVLSQRMYMGMSAAGPEAEAGIQIWSWILERAQKALSEGRTQVTTLRVDSGGVLLDASMTFDPEGGMARYLGQVKRPGRDLLRGLPAGRCPLIIALEWEDSPGTVGFSESLGRAILTTAAREARIPQDKLEAVVRKSALINRKLPGSSAAFSLSPEDDGLSYWGLYLTSEADTVRRELRRLCEMSPELMRAWGAFPTATPMCQPETIGGVEADVYSFEIKSAGSPMQPMMRAIYGQQPTLYMAPHPEGLAYAFGARESTRANLAALLAPDAAPLGQDPRVEKLLAVLSPRPQSCVLVDIPAAIAGLAAMVERLGLPLPRLEFGRERTALAGMAVYLEPQAIRAELYVPAEPVKTLVTFLRKLDGAADEAY